MSEPSEEKLNASVKVMRSHDYCHFEVQLSSPFPVSIAEIDELRKKAARLTDKAVEQYKVAKSEASLRDRIDYDRADLKRRVDKIRLKPEGEWTPQETAAAKLLQDQAFWDRRGRYDYEDAYARDPRWDALDEIPF
jgi:hypothetical protein